MVEHLYDVGVLEKLEAVVEELCAMDPAALADTAAMLVLHRSPARLEAAATRAVAAFDTSGAWADDGARSAAAWLTVSCALPRSTAQRRVHLGRSLRHLPAAETAWVAGDIGEAHVAAVARTRTPVTVVALTRDEQMLVGQAKNLRYDHVAFGGRSGGLPPDCWPTGHSTPTPTGPRTPRPTSAMAGACICRRAWTAPGWETWCWTPSAGRWCPTHWGASRPSCSRLTGPRPEGAWAKPPATVSDLARTPAQRRADALVEMARRAGTADPNGRRPEPLFTVLVGYETLAGRVCELANGTVVTPGALVPWLPEAWIERVVFDSPSRVIDVGVARRLFTGATRRAVEVRDRECFHQFCDVPAEQWVSSGREPPPPALSGPDVTVSRHPAPTGRPEVRAMRCQ